MISELTRAFNLKLVGVADTLRAAENRLDLMYLTLHENHEQRFSKFRKNSSLVSHTPYSDLI